MSGGGRYCHGKADPWVGAWQGPFREPMARHAEPTIANASTSAGMPLSQVGNVVKFLASDDASYMTGQVRGLAGGLRTLAEELQQCSWVAGLARLGAGDSLPAPARSPCNKVGAQVFDQP